MSLYSIDQSTFERGNFLILQFTILIEVYLRFFTPMKAFFVSGSRLQVIFGFNFNWSVLNEQESVNTS